MTKISNFKQNSRVNKEGIRTGFINNDILEVDRMTRHEPNIQVFDDGILEPDTPEHRRYYYAKDKI
jgi:hypothetical protein